MKFAIVAAITLSPALPATAAPAASSAPIASLSGLTRLLQAELARFPSKSGIYVKHLGTGEEASVNPDVRFESASTIKLAIMVLAYRLAEQKKLDLDTRYEIKPADLRGGSGIFQHHDFGLQPTLRDLIIQMIITSDNTATDIIIKQVGGVAAVNAFLRKEGYTATRLNRTTLDFFRSIYAAVDPAYQALSAEDIFALGTDRPDLAASRLALIQQVQRRAAARDLPAIMRRLAAREESWFGVMTPRESARLLESIEQGTAASKLACLEMKRILLAQQAGTRKLPHFLSVPVAHKTGEIDDVTNDIGIIYARSGPIVITSFNMNMSGLQADGDDRIGTVARLVTEYFDGSK